MSDVHTPPPLMERIFQGCTPAQALDQAEHLLQIRAELVAFSTDRGAEFEHSLAELREVCAVRERALQRHLESLRG